MSDHTGRLEHMFEHDASGGTPRGSTGPGALTTAELTRLVDRLPHLEECADDAARIKQIRVLEMIKSACAAAQARVTVAFAASQRAEQAAAGLRNDQVGRGVGAQVALARRDSAHRGGRHLGLAEALVGEMPHTLAALEAGMISEWRATIVVRETACLSAEHRSEVDAELADRLPGLGDGQIERQARAAAYRLDPQAFMRRIRGAHADRRVTCRPAPDTMARLTGFLPAALGVAAHAALARAADQQLAQGDPRTRNQIMADLYYARLTGRECAAPDAVSGDDAGDADGPFDVPVEVNLVLTDTTLFGGDHEPALLQGYGPIPAALARRVVRDTTCSVWLRRLYTRPGDGALVAMDSRSRAFPDGLRRFLILRDQTCRTPWCDAPIRHADHVTGVADGGETSAGNGQGLCAACNYAKALPGWSACVGRYGETETTTPTGHTYSSLPPPLPGAPHRPGRPPDLTFGSKLEHRIREFVQQAA